MGECEFWTCGCASRKSERRRAALCGVLLMLTLVGLGYLFH